MKQIENVLALTVGTATQTVDVGGLAFLMENLSESASVYFREKRDDGLTVTADNGFALGPGAVTQVPLTAVELSVIASAAGTDVRLMLLNEM